MHGFKRPIIQSSVLLSSLLLSFQELHLPVSTVFPSSGIFRSYSIYFNLFFQAQMEANLFLFFSNYPIPSTANPWTLDVDPFSRLKSSITTHSHPLFQPSDPHLPQSFNHLLKSASICFIFSLFLSLVFEGIGTGVGIMMEKDSLRNTTNTATTTASISYRSGGDGGGLLRTSSETITGNQTTSDFVLQWGNRKRLRCMKVQVKDSSSNPTHRTTARVDRRVVRTNKETSNQPSTTNNNNSNHQSNGYFNLRQRRSPPQQPPQRVLRNSENSTAMRGLHHQSNGGGVRAFTSPDRYGGGGVTNDKRGNNNHVDNNNRSAVSSEQDREKGGCGGVVVVGTGGGGGGGSSSGSGDAAAAGAPPAWPPKFMIALTNKEKEEDFFAFKGSKLPQRPKKRAKFIQRTLNLVSPGSWLCDLTLERYEVREKKIAKKRPRGLKAMGNYVESDSE